MNAINDASVPARPSGLWPTDAAYPPYRELDAIGSSPLRRLARWLFPAPEVASDADPSLDEILRTLGTGGWRIRRATAHALALLVRAAHPQVIVEFGSGVSTVVLAAITAAGGQPRRIISIEEHPGHAEKTRDLLARFGFADAAVVVTAPVVRRRIGAWEGFAYAVQARNLGAALDGRRADMVFVDGPASWLRNRGDCRYGTLLSVRPWAAERAVFLVDDALRPDDLAILRRWRELPFIDVHGVVFVGRGLGVGCLHGPLSRPAGGDAGHDPSRPTL